MPIIFWLCALAVALFLLARAPRRVRSTPEIPDIQDAPVRMERVFVECAACGRRNLVGLFPEGTHWARTYLGTCTGCGHDYVAPEQVQVYWPDLEGQVQ